MTAADPTHATEVRALYADTLYLQAHRRASALQLFDRQVDDVETRLLLARLLRQTGGVQRGRLLTLSTYRRARRDPEACAEAALTILSTGDALAAWRFVQRVGELAAPVPAQQASWCLARAEVLLRFRDFDGAEALVARARDTGGDEAWTWVVEAHLRAAEDRREQALEAARRGLALRPWYRPAVQAVASLLCELDRTEEALALLTEADGRVEAAAIAFERGRIELELDRPTAAHASWLRAAALAPAMEESFFCGLASCLCEAAYRAGDDDEVRRLAPATGSEATERLAARLHEQRRRVALPVRFVRQHHMTCAPATLSAVSAYWGVTAEHLSVAEEICYDGTPAHSERSWAEQHGFVAKEFAVNWEAVVALVDRGVTFTLTLTGATTAHLVAVIGYDALRRTLIIRDPTFHSRPELDAEALTELAAHGPRGMTLVPQREAARLEGLPLPDAELYDELHALRVALDRHDRPVAAAHADALHRAAPAHRLALVAERILAGYDADPSRLRAAVQRLRAAHPDDVGLLLAECSLLRELGRRDERLALLEERAAGGEPVVLAALAAELLADAREHERVESLLRRVQRHGLGDGLWLATLAQLRWTSSERDEATHLLRLAACLRDHDEGRAQQFFSAARDAYGADVALAFLATRSKRLVGRSGAPAMTLAAALQDLGRLTEARASVEEALQARPDDGELSLHAAQLHARAGGRDRAHALLSRAEGHVRRQDWLRAAARVARAAGDADTAERQWREVVELEPLALDAHEELAQLLATRAGAGIVHLEAALQRFPFHRGLRRLLATGLGRRDPAAAERVLRLMIDANADETWAHRELALGLIRRGRWDDARAALDVAWRLEPCSAANAAIGAHLAERAGRRPEALAAYQRALRLEPDSPTVARGLAELIETDAEHEELAALLAELAAGPGLPGRTLLALPTPGGRFGERLLAVARTVAARRPDDRQAAAAVVAQLRGLGQLDEALAEARRTTEGSALAVDAWFELADVHAARGEKAAQREALERALGLDAGFAPAALALARLHAEQDHFADARAVLDGFLALQPDDAEAPLLLARLCAAGGANDEAWDRLRAHLVRLPGDLEAWDVARAWASAWGRNDELLALARRTAGPAAPPNAHVALARILAAIATIDEALVAYERALALDPLHGAIHDERAQVLASGRRFAEAEIACRPAVYGDVLPVPLRGRAAWIRAERGDVAGAIADMRALLREEPRYVWGIERIAEWCRQTKQPALFREVAEELVALRPGDPGCLVRLGEALLDNGERSRAREVFERVLALRPHTVEAGMGLFDMALQDGDAEAAAGWLDRCGDRGNEFVAARVVHLRLAEGNTRGALDEFEALCRRGSEEIWPLESTALALVRRGLRAAMVATIERALDRTDGTPILGRLWIAWRSNDALLLVWPRLGRLLDRGAVGLHAAARLAELLVERPWRLRALVAWRGRVLRRHPMTWGAIGWALVEARLFGAARRWLADWARRTDLVPRRLRNVATALRAGGDDDGAAQVSRAALALSPDSSSDEHRLWLAFDAAVTGDLPRAEETLLAVPDRPGELFFSFLRALTAALVLAHDASRGPPAQRAWRARTAIDLAANRYPGGGTLRRRVIRRAVAAVRRVHGGPAAFLWWVIRW